MKTFFIGKEDDDAEHLAGRIAREEDDDLVLVLPKGASVRKNRKYFDRLKKEARAAGKKILIESVDEEVLRAAKAAGIAALHPLFEGEKKTAVSDVVVGVASREEKPRRQRSQEESGRRKRATPWKSILALAGAGIAAVAAVTAFGSGAEITVRFTKTPFSYTGEFLADIARSGVDAETRAFPGQLFTSEKNLTQLFPASGLKRVSEKAAGAITVYNAYSSEPQVLVAATRFATPDGKIFRLASQIVVPGAEIKEGKILPSKIKATIVADAPGEAYNLGPVSRLTIPGFKGTLKYDRFYGEIEALTQGGFVGEKRVPTPADIQAGKEQTAAILKGILDNTFLLGYPPDAKIVPGASNLEILRLSVNEAADGNGNFSVFGEARVKAIGFREAHVKNLLAAIASGAAASGMTLEPLEIGYGEAKPDFGKGTLSLLVSATGTLTTDFDRSAFTKAVAGKQPAEAERLLSELPGFENAKISLWPFWLRRIPADPSRVTVVAE